MTYNPCLLASPNCDLSNQLCARAQLAFLFLIDMLIAHVKRTLDSAAEGKNAREFNRTH